MEPTPHQRIADLDRSIGHLEAAVREPATAPDERPVFLVAIGWRSGSTLMQRVLMTDPQILVWGEALNHLAMVSRLMRPLHGFTDSWPPGDHWISHLGEVDLTTEWVANLTPDASHLKAAYRAFLDTWLAAPARARGFARWGVKEVRWSAEEAIFLRWLYPDCRFVLTIRHPVYTYLSLKQAGFTPGERGFVLEWPDRWIADLESFARHWNDLALSWAAVIERLDVTWIRYEDLMAGRIDLIGLGHSLDLALDPGPALAAKVGGGGHSRGDDRRRARPGQRAHRARPAVLSLRGTAAGSERRRQPGCDHRARTVTSRPPPGEKVRLR